jgi:hypothetical protein
MAVVTNLPPREEAARAYAPYAQAACWKHRSPHQGDGLEVIRNPDPLAE